VPHSCLLSVLRPPPRPPLFPYTTLFRSLAGAVGGDDHRQGAEDRPAPADLRRQGRAGVRPDRRAIDEKREARGEKRSHFASRLSPLASRLCPTPPLPGRCTPPARPRSRRCMRSTPGG